MMRIRIKKIEDCGLPLVREQMHVFIIVRELVSAVAAQRKR